MPALLRSPNVLATLTPTSPLLHRKYEEDKLQQSIQSSLKGYQRKFLRSSAHRLKPVLMIGQKGVTDSVISALEAALCRHELIKIKFIEEKERGHKEAILDDLQRTSGATLVGMVGHIAILYRQHPDRDKRKIRVPVRPGSDN